MLWHPQVHWKSNPYFSMRPLSVSSHHTTNGMTVQVHWGTNPNFPWGLYYSANITPPMTWQYKYTGDKPLLFHEAFISQLTSPHQWHDSTCTLGDKPLLFHESFITQPTSHHQWHDSTSTLGDKPLLFHEAFITQLTSPHQWYDSHKHTGNSLCYFIYTGQHPSYRNICNHTAVKSVPTSFRSIPTQYFLYKYIVLSHIFISLLSSMFSSTLLIACTTSVVPVRWLSSSVNNSQLVFISTSNPQKVVKKDLLCLF